MEVDNYATTDLLDAYLSDQGLFDYFPLSGRCRCLIGLLRRLRHGCGRISRSDYLCTNTSESQQQNAGYAEYVICMSQIIADCQLPIVDLRSKISLLKLAIGSRKSAFNHAHD